MLGGMLTIDRSKMMQNAQIKVTFANDIPSDFDCYSVTEK